MTAEILKVLVSVFAFMTAFLTFLTYFQKKKHSRETENLKKTIDKLKRENYSLRPALDPEWDRSITIEAKHLIQVLGISYLGPFLHCREELIDFLKNRKGRLQVLLLDPESDAFAERSRFEDDNVNRLNHELQASISILKDIRDKSRSNNLEVRLHRKKPDRSLYVIDSDDRSEESGIMLINYYPQKAKTRGYVGERYLASQSLLRDKDSYEKNLVIYKTLWSSARTMAL
ncbi:MAG: hypothetical protein WBF13_10450 [Candidatus Zixiibacteriota bacterium]